MTAFVGYRIDPYTGEGVPIAAGMDYRTVFSSTFARLAPEVGPFHCPNMAVRDVDITEDQAALLEKICADHLGASNDAS